MQIKDWLLELLFPSFCINCHRLGPILCANCYHGLNFYFQQKNLDDFELNFKKIYFDQLQIMAQFGGSLAKVIKALKYQNSKNLAPFLAKMLWRHLPIPQADLVTFIPLHPQKLRSRTYNQCQEIALALGKIINKPVKNILDKNTNNQAQARIKDQNERLVRMKNVFVIRKKYINLIKNKTIILIDDVVTTGATINEASRIIKSFGAKQVIAIVLASKMD